MGDWCQWYTAPVEYAQEKHHVIRETLRELYGEAADVVPALYGGSVNLENATRLFVQPDIDGLYVGRVAWMQSVLPD